MKKSVKTGVVATRTRNGFREVLLVSTKKNRWGLPKGNLIPRLGKKRTALEEAYEEAGVLGEIRNSRRVRLERSRWTLDLYVMRVAKQLLADLELEVLLITLGDLGMLVCQPGSKPFHIPTLAREVFDVSGAGDTVIGTYTLAVAAGADPIEAAMLANHAAGVVVGKLGTATVTPKELLASI